MLIKHDYSGYAIQTGNEELDKEMGDQLNTTHEEITIALNDAGLVPQVLKAIIKLRSDRHSTLIRKLG